MKKSVVYSLVLLMGTAILCILLEYYRAGAMVGFLFIAASVWSGLQYSAMNQEFGTDDIQGEFYL
ncbi:hypothetical protein [Bacillus sp. FJAT-27445]|uniref:hypothetical protein n=1 Tax=Bacillus sp. FJAT-27445 TaxID=1679166 RepID=UPI000743E031|nr:hypothetical protein [Bacillus sp. FJAT-27445]